MTLLEALIEAKVVYQESNGKVGPVWLEYVDLKPFIEKAAKLLESNEQAS